MSYVLSKESVFGIVFYVLSVPFLVNLNPVYFLSLGFVVMNFVIIKDIAPNLFINKKLSRYLQLFYNFIFSVFFSSLIVGAIFYVSFYLLS